MIFGWLSHFFGIDNGSGSHYLFWSGPGSDLGELALFGALIGLFKHHSCHVRGCWRLGKHPVVGGVFRVCARHHPTVPDGGATVEQVWDAHLEPDVTAAATLAAAADVLRRVETIATQHGDQLAKILDAFHFPPAPATPDTGPAPASTPDPVPPTVEGDDA